MKLKRVSKHVLGFVVVGLVAMACATEEPVTEPEAIEQVSLAQSAACQCLQDKELLDFTCYDSCFSDVRCLVGAQAACGEACVYPDVGVQAGQSCEAFSPLPPFKAFEGVCAEAGLPWGQGSGCCPGCIAKDEKGTVVCYTGDDPDQCGGPGTECKSCAGSNPCVEYACQDKGCVSRPVEDGQGCKDDSGAEGVCQNGACCLGCVDETGRCRGGTTAGFCGVGGGSCASCTTGNACLNPICKGGECGTSPKAEGEPCSDDDVCNGAETCDGGGECQAGTALNCDDNNPCTADDCDPEDGCIWDNDDEAACSDGQACTPDDHCQDGECVGTVSCDDGNPCTMDSCGNNGVCENEPVEDDTPCDDGSNCTDGETCQNGVCTGDPNAICHDEDNPCEISDCSAAGAGCVAVARPDGTRCNDGDPCTTSDSCQDGVCEGGSDVDCDDNNACTEDTCTPGVGCEYTDASGECADGDVCTIRDQCVDGECVGTPVECTALSECHEVGTCNPDTGVCDDPRKEDGTECGNGTCEAGECIEQDEPVSAAGAGGSGGQLGSGGAAEGGARTEAGSTSVSVESAGAENAGAESAGQGGDTITTVGEGDGGAPEGEEFFRDEGGCNCEVQRAKAHGFGLWALGLLVSVWARRRRSPRARRRVTFGAV